MTRAVAAFFALALLAPSAADACGPRDVCADVINSLIGIVQSEGFAPTIDRVRLEWSSDSEKSAGLVYRISRYNCADPATCSTWVAFVNAVGTCGQEQFYQFTDTPPAPVEQWTYRLVVMRGNNAQFCSVDTVPE